MEGQIFTGDLVVLGDEFVVLGNDTITTTDDAITTTDEAVETTDEAVREPVITVERAQSALLEGFGPLVDADYLPGKTRFRDALCDLFGISALESEELVDQLEGSGRIQFISSEEGLGWRIEHSEDRP